MKHTELKGFYEPWKRWHRGKMYVSLGASIGFFITGFGLGFLTLLFIINGGFW